MQTHTPSESNRDFLEFRGSSKGNKFYCTQSQRLRDAGHCWTSNPILSLSPPPDSQKQSQHPCADKSHNYPKLACGCRFAFRLTQPLTPTPTPTPNPIRVQLQFQPHLQPLAAATFWPWQLTEDAMFDWSWLESRMGNSICIFMLVTNICTSLSASYLISQAYQIKSRTYTYYSLLIQV